MVKWNDSHTDDTNVSTDDVNVSFEIQLNDRVIALDLDEAVTLNALLLEILGLPEKHFNKWFYEENNE